MVLELLDCQVNDKSIQQTMELFSTLTFSHGKLFNYLFCKLYNLGKRIIKNLS
jgi:hypothetical protein